jgi:hypothetical protein
MTSVHNGKAPIALPPGEGEALWFLGSLVTLKAADETTDGRVAVLEHYSPRGSGSPCTCTAARTSGSTSPKVS